MSWLTLSPAEEAALAVSRRGVTATKVTKDAKGLTFDLGDDSELNQFTKHVNQEQSAWTGVAKWTEEGRLRLLAKELTELADAAERAGVRQTNVCPVKQSN
jgi:hypothetical protein